MAQTTLLRATMTVLALAIPLIAPAPPAIAQPLLPPVEALSQAVQAVERGDHERAVDLLAPLLTPFGGGPSGALEVQDIAEAWRTYGLALFFLDRRDSAERAFLAYLKLDVDAGLDPALVPPEAIVFFEDIRSRHAAELRKYRPKPTSKRYRALNLIPVAGQIQNRHYTKAWLIGSTGVALAATHVTTYLVLDSWCDQRTGVCQSGGESRTDTARSLRVANLVSGTMLIGLLAYSIFDGFYHFNDSKASVSVGLGLIGADGGMVRFMGRF